MRKSILVILALVAFTIPIRAQNTWILPKSGAPTGSCNFNQFTANTVAGTLYRCNSATHAWVLITSGGSGTVTQIIAGSGLTGGTITTSGTVALATAQATRTAVFNDAAPVVGDDGIFTLLNPATAVHLTRVSCGVTGTTSVVFNLVKGAASLISDLTATAGDANTVVVTTWANGSAQCGGTTSCAVAAHTPVTVHIGTIVGTPTNLACSVDWTVD